MSHEEIEIEAVGIEVSSQPVELYKVLKLANAVSGGGEAKMAISEGYVIVNGELETRKRRKIYDGDLIAFNEEFYVLVCNVAPAPKDPKSEKKKPEKKMVQTKPALKPQRAERKPNKGEKNVPPRLKSRGEKPSEEKAPNGRRKISF